MNKQWEWNRREFIVKPILWAGAASVLGGTDLLLANPLNETATGPVLQRTLGKTGLTIPVVSMGVMNADVPGLLRRAYEGGVRPFGTGGGVQPRRDGGRGGVVAAGIRGRDPPLRYGGGLPARA